MSSFAVDHTISQPLMVGDSAEADQANLDKLVAAFVRIRGIDHLEGALITRHWLAADMDVPVESLDGLLKLFRFQGLIGLPNEHIVTVEAPQTMRALALGLPLPEHERTHTEDADEKSAVPVWAGISTWH